MVEAVSQPQQLPARPIGIGATITYNAGGTPWLALGLGAAAGWAIGNYFPRKYDTTLVRIGLAVGGAALISYAAETGA